MKSEVKLQHDREARNREKIEDIELKPKLNVPKTNQEWQQLNDTLQYTVPNLNLYETIESKFKAMNDYIYDIVEFNFGLKDDAKPNIKKKEKKRKDEEQALKKEKKMLKKELKQCQTEEERLDNRKRFYKILKLHNKLRKAKMQSENDMIQNREKNKFKKNPYQYAKDILKPKKNDAEPTFDKTTAENYFSECYKDETRGNLFQPMEDMVEPPKPENEFDVSLPTRSEVEQYIHKRRNGSAGGVSQIQYVMIKKCKYLMSVYCSLIILAWQKIIVDKTDDIPVHWTIAIRKLIAKTDKTDDPSLFRDINLSNIDGKIFFGIMSKRASKFMTSNGYIDTTIQKGYIARIPGVLEHTYQMTEILKNSREHQRSICVSWIDLRNAFGSVGHNLIDYTLEWYHWPESIRKAIHDYYAELYVRVQTKQYNTEWIRIEKGIFQGDTLADILFNSPWNICLNLIKKESTVGYNHKESNVRTKLQGYVDDLTVLTQTPKQHQKVLDVLSGFLEWSGMEAKPSKCKSFAQKVFEKNSKNTKFKATTPKSFSAYDPQLKISGKPISFLQDDPVKKSIKMLGKWIDGKNRKKEDKTLVKEKLEDYLTKTNDVALTGVQKSWIYANMIIPCLTWELTIYELPASFVDTLDSLITRYLKKWLGVARCADPNLLYRSREHFGLQLPNIKTCFKKAQTGVEHKMKHSKDQNIKSLHNAKSKCDLKKVRWTGNKQLEKVERAIVLDKMAFAGQNNREGLGYCIEEK